MKPVSAYNIFDLLKLYGLHPLAETDARCFNVLFLRAQLRPGLAVNRVLLFGVILGLCPLFAWAEVVPPVRDWRADDLAVWNDAAADSTIFTLLSWWLLMTLPGWLTWPLFSRLLVPLGGAGFLLARTLAWLLTGWIAWWLASVGLGSNTARLATLVVVLVCMSGIATGWLWRDQISSFFREHWRVVVRGEILFALSLLAFALLRMLNPDLWHPLWGGEKMMEFAYLSGIMRSAEFPPADPHFAGETINYYYFGLYLVAFIAKLGSFPPEIAFTLSVPTLFALSALNAYAVACSWFMRDRRHAAARTAPRAALLAPVLVCVAGNPAGALALWSAIGGKGRFEYDFWQPSRVIDGTINEFPFWSFVFADLHPHLVSIPFFLVFLALLLVVLRAHGQTLSIRTLVLPVWLLGALACINPWDLPTAFGLLCLVVFISGEGVSSASSFATRAAIALGCLALAWFAFSPFSLQYEPVGVAGVGFVRSPDDPLEWLQVWALPLFVLGSRLLLEAPGQPGGYRAVAVAGAIALVPALAGWFVAAFCLFFLGLAVRVFKRNGDTGANARFVEILILVGFLLLSGMQFVYVRDFLGGSDFYRMNTVFKFSIHAWLMLMLAVSLVLPRLLSDAGRQGMAGRLWLLPVTALCLASAVYPVVGTGARINARIDGAHGLAPTLDALAFMRVGHYRPPGGESVIRLDEDLAAVHWLRDNVHVHASILESSQVDYYRHFGTRIASLTGLSGLHGLHQAEQRDPGRAAARARLHDALWSARDAQAACALYEAHGIDIVYAGQLERIEHAAMVERLPAVADRGCIVPVFRSGSTTVYFSRAFVLHRMRVGMVSESPDPLTSGY